jgi:hypothetical protein
MPAAAGCGQAIGPIVRSGYSAEAIIDVAPERGRGIQHMRTHSAGCGLSVTFRDRLHDGVMLVAGLANAIALPQLGAAEGAEPRTHVLRLLGEK